MIDEYCSIELSNIRKEQIEESKNKKEDKKTDGKKPAVAFPKKRVIM